jgi:hypothetical protein
MASWLTQTPAARRLGITVKRLDQLVAEGDLVAAVDFYGRRRYDPAPIELMRARIRAGFKQATKLPAAGGAAGKAQAHAFKLFSEQRLIREVVIETELAPSVVQDLLRQYAEMGKELLITHAALQDVRDVLDWRGEATEKGLVLAIRARLRRAFNDGQNAAADPPNHTTEGKSSGNIDTGATGTSGGAGRAGEGLVRGDPRGQADE